MQIRWKKFASKTLLLNLTFAIFSYDTKSRCNEQNGGATQVVWHCDSFHQFFLFKGGGGQGVGERSGDLVLGILNY